VPLKKKINLYNELAANCGVSIHNKKHRRNVARPHQRLIVA
jgi:hypothetical protein